MRLESLAAALAVAFVLAASTTLAAPALEPRDIASKSKLALVTIFAVDASGQQTAQGSGFFLSADGVIATNFHVIEGAASLQIKVHTGEIYDHVFLRHADPRRDLAILRIPIAGAPHLKLGDDTALVVGDRLYAMGNPVGLEATFSDGLLSARRLMEGTEMIQMTTPISHGSSGGPVMNAAGDVIGISSAGIESGQNLNLTLPAHYIGPVLALGSDQLFPTGMPAAPAPASTAAAGAAAPAAASGQASDDPHVAIVRQQLDAGATVASSAGYSALGDYFGALDAGANDTVQVEVDGTSDYFVVGACDSDCGDLDVAFVSSGGDILASDTADDDKPLVSVEEPAAGSYTLIVNMAQCKSAPCRFGLRVFSRP